MEDLVAHARYEWDCDNCGAVNTEDHDPTGEAVQCEDCGTTFGISEVR